MDSAVNHVEATRPLRLFKPVRSASVLVLVIVCGTWLWWASHRGLTAAKFERTIRAEVTPMCSRQVVEGWFDRHRIEHYWSVETRVAYVGKQTVAELAGLRDADLRGVCWAVVEGPEVNVSLVFHGSIGIYFFFDDRGRCVGHYIDEFAYEL